MGLTFLLKDQSQFFGLWGDFENHCKKNRLPQYSFIEPPYYDNGAVIAADQHPDHNVQAGDNFIRQVYEAVRSNADTWHSTLLLVVWDEHAAFPITWLRRPSSTPTGSPPRPHRSHSTATAFAFRRWRSRPTSARARWTARCTSTPPFPLPRPRSSLATRWPSHPSSVNNMPTTCWDYWKTSRRGTNSPIGQRSPPSFRPMPCRARPHPLPNFTSTMSTKCTRRLQL